MENNRYTTQLLDGFYPECKEPSDLKDVFLVMEYIPYDLADLLANPEGQMKEEQVITISYNLLLCI